MPTFLSASLAHMQAFRAAVEDQQDLISPTKLSVLKSDQLNELPLGHILCHLARRFLFWFCKLSSQIYCITEQWSEQENVRFLPVLVNN